MATIVFFPEGAYGPTNNCVGIADVLRARGHECIFIVEESFAGTLEAQGFEERLLRPQRGLGRLDWNEADGSVATDFHQPHGERLKLLRDTGFELEALHELYAPDGPADEVRYYMPRAWAQSWPGEEVWVARLTSAE